MSGDTLEENFALSSDSKKVKKMKGEKKKSTKTAVAMSAEPTKKVKKVKSEKKSKSAEKSGDTLEENFVLTSEPAELTKKEKKKAAKRARIEAGMPEHLKSEPEKPVVEEPKKKKRKKNKKPQEPVEVNTSNEIGYDHTSATARMQNAFQQHKPILTQLEIDQILIPANSISSSIRPRTERMAVLPTVCKDAASTIKNIRAKGTEGVRVLVLVMSAERGLAVVKSCVEWQPTVKPLGLFRHGGGSNKVQKEKQVSALAKNDVTVAVGTPGRIKTLQEEGGLNLDNLEMLVLDMDKNVKEMSVLDMRETRADIISIFKEMVPEFKKKPDLKCVLY